MSKPMYCPMTFSRHTGQCTPDCAWAVKTDQGQYGCCIPQMCASMTYENVGLNLITSVRPLKDDND